VKAARSNLQATLPSGVNFFLLNKEFSAKTTRFQEKTLTENRL